MKFIIKYFPEITIKSKPVRQQLSRQLRDNIAVRLREVDPGVHVNGAWDRIAVTSGRDDDATRSAIVEMLAHTPGIAWFMDAVEHPLGDIDEVVAQVVAVYRERLVGRTFAVRCKRAGRHPFNSQQVERAVGTALEQAVATAGVDLSDPDVTVRLEIRDDRVYVVNRRYEGLGGFPIGGVDPVLSLVSGGFDSTVASYLCMKRGMLTHFLFFNLGGRAHEIGVKEASLYLWMRYGASHRVKFVTVPFEAVVAGILKQVGDRYMGVVLKRMMLRAASAVAHTMGIQALVTGESVAQVSSQTLANLAVIDSASDMLVLRPLIASDKRDIIDLARHIGVEEFAANMPEYCGVISNKPATRARAERVEAEEQRFDDAVLRAAVAAARTVDIDEVARDIEQAEEVEVVAEVPARGVVVDLRHPDETERAPLAVEGVELLTIPFYELHTRFGELDRLRHYYLYCDKGVMSRLHAAHLVAEGHRNVSVWRPRGR